MNRLVISVLGAFLAFGTLVGCEKVQTATQVATVAQQPIGNQAVADARNTVYALKASYGAALRVAVEYARLPSCTPPDRPVVCSSDAVVRGMASLQPKVSSAINAAERVALQANPDMSTLRAAISTAQAAYGEFKKLTEEAKP